MDEDGKPLKPGRRHTFVVEACPETDVLIRVLGPFAVQEATITDIRLDHRATGLSIAIEACGVSDDRAALIASRLNGLAAVHSVGLGWKTI